MILTIKEIIIGSRSAQEHLRFDVSEDEPLKTQLIENDQCVFLLSYSSESIWTRPLERSKMQFRHETVYGRRKFQPLKAGKFMPFHWFNWKCTFKKLDLPFQKEIPLLHSKTIGLFHTARKSSIFILVPY